MWGGGCISSLFLLAQTAKNVFSHTPFTFLSAGSKTFSSVLTRAACSGGPLTVWWRAGRTRRATSSQSSIGTTMQSTFGTTPLHGSGSTASCGTTGAKGMMALRAGRSSSTEMCCLSKTAQGFGELHVSGRVKVPPPDRLILPPQGRGGRGREDRGETRAWQMPMLVCTNVAVGADIRREYIGSNPL